MAKKTRTDYSMLNIIAGMGGYAVNLIMGVICRMIFTRTLAADYLGINGLFTNILTMLSLAELGIGSAIGYALYKPLANDDKPKIASLMKFYARCYYVIGAVVAVLGIGLIHSYIYSFKILQRLKKTCILSICYICLIHQALIFLVIALHF